MQREERAEVGQKLITELEFLKGAEKKDENKKHFCRRQWGNSAGQQIIHCIKSRK